MAGSLSASASTPSKVAGEASRTHDRRESEPPSRISYGAHSTNSHRFETSRTRGRSAVTGNTGIRSDIVTFWSDTYRAATLGLTTVVNLSPLLGYPTGLIPRTVTGSRRPVPGGDRRSRVTQEFAATSSRFGRIRTARRLVTFWSDTYQALLDACRRSQRRAGRLRSPHTSPRNHGTRAHASGADPTSVAPPSSPKVRRTSMRFVSRKRICYGLPPDLGRRAFYRRSPRPGPPPRRGF